MSRAGRIAALLSLALVAALARPAVADDAAAEARAHFQKAEAAFARRDYRAALAGYEAAHEAKPLPGFLFNIGQCHRNLGDHARALAFYRRYLAEDPDIADRGVVEQLIAEEEQRAGVTPTTPPPLAPPPVVLSALIDRAPVSPSEEPPLFATSSPPPPTSTPVYRRWWFWTAVGGAVAAGIVTAFLMSGADRPSAPSGALRPIDWR